MEDRTVRKLNRRLTIDEKIGKGLTRKEVAHISDTITRRGFVGGGMALAGLAAAAGLRPGVSSAAAISNLGIIPDDLPAVKYKAATVEVGAASTWVTHGIDTSIFFGKLLGAEVTPFDGQFSPENQLQALQTISAETWDWVQLHPAASDALVDGTDAIIAKGTPLVVMDTRVIQDPEANAAYGHLTFLEPDNIYMGSTVANELFKAIGGEGEVIHTQGQLGHTGAQGRAAGFNATLANYPNIKVVDETPGDWQVEKTAALWQDLLQRFPNVKGGFFHSDDMALAARSVVEAAGMQDQVKLVGVDGLRNVCEAILADKITASVINPSGRIHGGAIWAGYLKVSGTDMYQGGGDMPKFVRTDGGPITKDNAAGYIWLGDNLQY
jgi:ribose transport system substrate-binding protein